MDVNPLPPLWALLPLLLSLAGVLFLTHELRQVRQYAHWLRLSPNARWPYLTLMGRLLLARHWPALAPRLLAPLLPTHVRPAQALTTKMRTIIPPEAEVFVALHHRQLVATGPCPLRVWGTACHHLNHPPDYVGLRDRPADLRLPRG